MSYVRGKPFQAKVFASPQAWLEYYAIPVPEAGCWIFEGGIDSRGYGRVGRRPGVSRRASRVSYHLFYGSIPNGQCVCHRCDVPLCINPNHLFLGSQADNMRDMHRKGRAAKPYKARCKNGHELISVPWANRKICRICLREACQRFRDKRRAQRIGLS